MKQSKQLKTSENGTQVGSAKRLSLAELSYDACSHIFSHIETREMCVLSRTSALVLKCQSMLLERPISRVVSVRHDEDFRKLCALTHGRISRVLSAEDECTMFQVCFSLVCVVASVKAGVLKLEGVSKVTRTRLPTYTAFSPPPFMDGPRNRNLWWRVVTVHKIPL